MSFRLILFIIIQLAALIFFIELLRRLSKRAGEYHLADTRKTIPFGFLRLRYIVALYVISYILWLALSIILYLVFVDTTSIYYYGNGENQVIQNMGLNL